MCSRLQNWNSEFPNCGANREDVGNVYFYFPFTPRIISLKKILGRPPHFTCTVEGDGGASNRRPPLPPPMIIFIILYSRTSFYHAALLRNISFDSPGRIPAYQLTNLLKSSI